MATSLLNTILIWALLAAATTAGEVRWTAPRPDWLPDGRGPAEGTVHQGLAGALAAARPGDTVAVIGGTHQGRFTIDRAVRVEGWGRSEPPQIVGTVTVTADGAALDRLLFEGGGGPVVEVRGASGVTVSRLEVRRTDGGILLKDARDCRILDNRLDRAGRALVVEGGGGNLLADNVVDRCGEFPVEIEASPGNVLRGNVVLEPGWTGVVLHSGSGHTTLVGNTVVGGEVGLSIQTDDNRVLDNLMRGCGRGLLLGASPRGMDPASRARTAFLDSDDGSARIDATRNEVARNRFEACVREGVLLRGAGANLLTDNVVHGSPHGFVLQSGADRNVLEGNRVSGASRADVAVIDSAANTLSGFASARLVEAPDTVTRDVDDVRRLAGGADVPPPPPALFGDGLLLLGDLHTHSVLSDGTTSPEELLTYARDVLGLAFCALSDHAEILDLRADRWPRLKQACRDLTREGFLAVAGYEVTYPVFWDGHYNVYHPHLEGRLHRSPYDQHTGLLPTEAFTPGRLLEALRRDADGALVVRHHFGPTPDYWEDAPDDPELCPLTEICSVHGVFSGDRDVDENINARRAEYAGHDTTVARGLALGRVTGIVASSDSHYGFPGDRGLVGVIAREHSVEALFEALRARRTYGTTGAPIQLDMRVNGAPMGAVLPVASSARIEARVQGAGPLASLELLRDGRVVAQGEIDGRFGRLDLTDDLAPAPGRRYRVRALQADGHAAWSSPVWFDPPPPRRSDAARRLEKDQVSLLVYASALRAWHKLGLGALEGRSPSEALEDPALRDRVLELWPRLVESARAVNALGLELGLDDARVARDLIERWGHRWGGQLPRTAAHVDPIIDLDALAAGLGLPLP